VVFDYVVRVMSVVLLAAMAAPSANADCALPAQVRIVTVNFSPGIAKDSFASQPLVMYRAGPQRLRLEEAPDPANGIHQLIVTNWPDSWVVNLLDKTGQHAKDDDMVPVVHAPVITADPSLGVPAAWDKLEYGCESQFFAENKAGQVPTEKHDLVKHSLVEGAWRLTMVTARDSPRPSMMILSKDGKVIWAIRYTAYVQQGTAEPALFAKPEGITFSEPLE
jgi:hypothetical protein